jgi:uncharacterized repeat protein (TIGR01451 family)
MNRAFKAWGYATLIAAGALAAHAHAAPSGPVETRMEARKVVRSSDGKEALVAAETARPGDVIEYVVTYRNTGREAVRNLEVTLPIPAHTEFIHGTTRPAGAKASLDASAFGGMPLQRKVRRDGQYFVETVAYREYRYLRWYPGELAAGGSIRFRARVKVLE